MSDINAWLENLGLAKYQQIFTENDIDTDILAELNDADLRELGVSLGDRKRLLKAIDSRAASSITQRRSPSPQSISPYSPSNNAERRQLTVMFCDLVGSTALSTQLDPEDLRDLLQAYQSTCVEVIQRFDGFIARYMGDGILVYFGYPQASEFDAERALRSALGIVAAMQSLNTDKNLTQDVELEVRIGLATGVVIVGDLIGEGVSEERNVVGETPNLAARLQGLAQPNGIVIGSLTKDLAGDGFVYDDLGLHELKGIAGQVKAWNVSGEREIIFDSETDDQPRPTLVGREEELGLLRRAWSQSRSGSGQVVMISGEPGIGKSRLVDTIGNEVKRDGYTRITLRCSPYHTNSALYPMIQYLQRLPGWQRDDNADKKLAALEQVLSDYHTLPENSVSLLAALLSLSLPEERYPPLTLSPQQHKQQTLDLLIAWINEAAERQPTLWAWEDLHWADPSTLELLNLVIEQCPTVSILNVLTFRPDFTPPWPMRSQITPLTLNRLQRAEVESMIERHTDGKALPIEVVEHIISKADGVPLYVDELTKMIVSADFLRDVGDHYELTGPLSGIAIPATLQDSLMARLDRRPDVREVAQLGAVLGREFVYEILRAIIALDEKILQQSLNHLVDEELLYQRGRPPQARYIFKHALIQDVAYQSLLRRKRQQYHRQIAELFEARFAEIVETQPELVAHHYTEADLAEKAVLYWHQAGQRANDRSAYKEAINHLTTGLKLIQTLPETMARDQQELPMQTALGAAEMNVKGQGAAEVETAFARAYDLCQRLGDHQDVFLVLFGLWRFYVAGSNFTRAQPLAEDLLHLARQRDEKPLYVMAYYALGFNASCLGELPPAYGYFEQSIACYDLYDRINPLFHVGQDPNVACISHLARTFWLQGYPEQALTRTDEALTLAPKLDHSYSNCCAIAFASMVWQFRREPQKVYDNTVILIDLATENGFTAWLAMGKMLHGWALTSLNKQKQGFILTNEGLQDYRTSGAELFAHYHLTLLAHECMVLEQFDVVNQFLSESLELIKRTGERWWQAEVYRLKGELMLVHSELDNVSAEIYFQQALDIARAQQAKSLELRAAMSLAELWRQQGKIQQAHDLLAPVYRWFTEGFDTADLKDAKALLDKLSSSF